MPTRTTYLHNSTILQNFCLSVVRIKSCYMTPCSTWNAAARELRGYLFMSIVSVCLCVGDVQARVELLCVLKWKDTQRNGKSCRSNHSMNYCCTVIDIADSIDDTKFSRHIHLAVTNYKKKNDFHRGVVELFYFFKFCVTFGKLIFRWAALLPLPKSLRWSCSTMSLFPMLFLHA